MKVEPVDGFNSMAKILNIPKADSTVDIMNKTNIAGDYSPW